MQNAKYKKELVHGWQFRQCGTRDWLPATVPGCNFSDLLANSLIPDPFYGQNEKQLQWIENKDWEYQIWFDIEPDLRLSKKWFLNFEGLDTYCDVFLNGRRVAQSCNMFVPLEVDCNEFLVDGRNHLHLIFESPIAKTRPLFEQNGFTYPAENDKSDDSLSVFTRKAPYHFGWDWGPRFVTSGIWRPVSIIGTEIAQFSNVSNHFSSISANEAVLVFESDVMLFDGYQPDDSISIEIRCLNHPMKSQLSGVENFKSTHVFRIEEPKMWWPNGLGDPFLYEFEIRLISGECCVDVLTRKVGVRTIELVNEEDEFGQSFYFKINGHPVFIKGANYIPGDSFLERVDSRHHRQTFADAVDANMNMLRVWGGGVYQDDEFYDLADTHGILIWQDFMFACTLYPGDETFLKNVEREARANITRLRHHPCLAMWCGNNEIEMGIADWNWPEKFGYSDDLQQRLLSDYNRLFRDLLPSLVKELDSERYYLPSSPIGHWEHPEQDGKGNHHYWGVWHGEAPFSEYRRRIPRFMSEYGFQSFPLMQYVERYIPESDWTLESEAMKVHQKHPRGNTLIKQYMLDEYQEPKNFASLLYLSQVQQAWGLKQAFESHRKHKPYCMGTLYWQFNDCWPVASWSGIDYSGRWKALHYQAKRSFTPILPVIDIEGDEISITLVNDYLKSKKCTLEWTLFSLDGGVSLTGDHAVELGGNCSEPALTLSKITLLDGADQRNVVLHLIVRDTTGKAIATDNVYFVANKYLQLKQYRLEVAVSYDTFWQVHLTSDVLVKDLHIDVRGHVVNFSDNFFDLMPGQTKTISAPVCDALSTLSDLEFIEMMTFTSVFDTFDQGMTQ